VVRIRLICIIFVVIAASLSAKASYVGKGEVRGRVLESHRTATYTAFKLALESQHVTGPTLASPNNFLYRGNRMDEIVSGSTIHLWFESGADFLCDPCGLYVTKVEFADGRFGLATKTVPDTVANPNKSQISGWLTVLLVVVASLLVFGGFFRLRKRMR
jgi:hypothetical protein